MKVLQVVAGISSEAAGPSYSVQRLSAAVGSATVKSEIATTVDERSEIAVAGANSFPLDNLWARFLPTLRVSSGLKRCLVKAIDEGAIIHSHGLWLAPNYYPSLATKGGRSMHVVSPRGMLAPEALAFSSIKKRVMWMLMQRRALHNAACLHATCDAEAEEIRALGLQSPIAVIPNGIDIPPIAACDAEYSTMRTVLCLGRLHPKKGLDQLVAAWGEVESEFPDWNLRIVGPDAHGYRRTLERQVSELSLKRVSISGPLFGVDKQKAYQEAELFVLPTRNENFGLVVGEALAAKTPVICTKGAPWSGLERENCGWWIDYGAASLASTFRIVLPSSRGELHAMGARGRCWIERDFSWEKIGSSMRSVYGWIHGSEARPSCIRV